MEAHDARVQRHGRDDAQALLHDRVEQRELAELIDGEVITGRSLPVPAAILLTNPPWMSPQQKIAFFTVASAVVPKSSLRLSGKPSHWSQSR